MPDTHTCTYCHPYGMVKPRFDPRLKMFPLMWGAPPYTRISDSDVPLPKQGCQSGAAQVVGWGWWQGLARLEPAPSEGMAGFLDPKNGGDNPHTHGMGWVGTWKQTMQAGGRKGLAGVPRGLPGWCWALPLCGSGLPPPPLAYHGPHMPSTHPPPWARGAVWPGVGGMVGTGPQGCPRGLGVGLQGVFRLVSGLKPWHGPQTQATPPSHPLQGV